jgi:membrane dipeptidase
MHKIIDLHCDTVLALQAKLNLSESGSSAHIDIPGMKKGGIRLQIFACYVSSAVPEDQAFSDAVNLISIVKSFCLENPGQVELISNATEAENIMQSVKIGIMLAVENGYVIQRKQEHINELYQLGVRYMTLTHSQHLSWAASSGETWSNSYGLSQLGKDIIHRMNDLGMMVDVSHVHERTFWDVIENARKPIIASHSNCYAICPTRRNLTDEQIKAIAKNNGMIGINFYPGFLDRTYMEYQYANCKDLYTELVNAEKKFSADPQARYHATNQFYSDLQERMSVIRVNCQRIADHIEYIVNLVGDEYVGFGSDFDGIPSLPDGISGCADIPEIIAQLKNRGFSDLSIDKISNKNFLRVLKANESQNI